MSCRTWTYMIGMICGCALSSFGYAARIVMHWNPFDYAAFKVQIICLIIPPAFTTASIYLILKHICICFGAKWSRIWSRQHTWIFIFADILPLSAVEGSEGGVQRLIFQAVRCIFRSGLHGGLPEVCLSNCRNDWKLEEPHHAELGSLHWLRRSVGRSTDGGSMAEQQYGRPLQTRIGHSGAIGTG